MNKTNTVYVIRVLDHTSGGVTTKGAVSSMESALAVQAALKAYIPKDTVYIDEVELDAVVTETARILHKGLKPYTEMLNALNDLERLLG